jgi:hypothetical protein
MAEIGDLEQEFLEEQKGEGSLSIYLTNGDASDYIGYDVNPEDLEAIYFEGIGVPRWESLSGGDGTVESQTALYWERFNEKMADYPLIGRVRDTDERVEFTSGEVQDLAAECEKLAGSASDPKALRSLQKISIAANRADEQNAALTLKPSATPAYPGGF